MTTLARIEKMRDAEIQVWLRQVGQERATALAIALLGADTAIRQRVLRNMTPAAGAALEAMMAQQHGAPAEVRAQRAAELEALL